MLVDQIKRFREEIYVLTTFIVTSSRETSLARTAGQEARMWLGKLLGYIGNENPYPQSRNPSNETIHEESDVPENMDLSESGNLSDIQVIKELRRRVKILCDELEEEILIGQQASAYVHNELIMISLKQSLIRLQDCSMWLGQELNRIKNER